MNKNTLKIGFAFFLLTQAALAQTKQELNNIISLYDNEQSVKVIEEVTAREALMLANARRIASERGLPHRYTDDRGELVILSGINAEGDLLYTTTENFTGARTINAHQLYTGGTLGLNIQGQGMTAGVWDGGYVRETHVAVVGRVTLGEPNKLDDSHASHVGGTIISDGTGNIATRGVAFNASVISYEFDNDTSEMVQQAGQGMILSNHSYGQQSSTGTALRVFGKYDVFAQLFDTITNQFDFYLPVVSAGNDRGSGINPTKQGYDLLTDRSLAKNVMTVGAVNNVTTYNGPSSVSMSNFSSWGPADDGRIKPDIVAKGVSVLSLSQSSDTATAVQQGTSMSAPMVTGGLLLLQQLYNQQNNAFMRAYTAKGLTLLNAREAGNAPGPDPMFGWGLMDVAAAASHITNRNSTSIIDERVLAQGATYTMQITSNSPVLKVGICWNDPSSPLPNNVVDDPTPNLVNNLDLKVTDANGVDYFPWKLDLAQIFTGAVKGVNDVDNIEIVEIQAPAGTYTVTVSHRGNLSGGSERYALLINGLDLGSLSTPEQALENFVMYPNPAQNEVTISFNNALAGNKINVEIYDVLGQRVSSTSFDNGSNFEQRIDISALTSGIYLVRVGDGSSFSTKKLVIN